MLDPRLQSNEHVLQWFASWNETKIHPKAFISPQAFEDLTSMIKATLSYVKIRLTQNLSPAVYLHRLNSDLVENLFSSQRGVLNGCNTNPTILAYGRNLNSIVIGQNIVSKKRNGGTSSAVVGGAHPVKVLTNATFRNK